MSPGRTRRPASLPASLPASAPASGDAPRQRPAVRLSLQQPDGRHRALLPRHAVARWIRAALLAPAELTVRVVDEEEGRRLNLEFRGRDYATNVLTFDYAREPLVVADLVLCAPVLEREAQQAGLPLQAHYAHLVVHGTLHAQGFDHERPAEARRMESRESAVLQALGFADPYRRCGRAQRSRTASPIAATISTTAA